MSPVWCKVCGIRPAMFNENRCEDCWAADQDHYGRRKVRAYASIFGRKCLKQRHFRQFAQPTAMKMSFVLDW